MRDIIDRPDKTKKLAIIAILFAFIAIASAESIQYLNGTYCLNCTLDNPTFVNYTFPSGGTGNHTNLTNLNWANAGHIMDSSINYTITDGGIYSKQSSSGIRLIDDVPDNTFVLYLFSKDFFNGSQKYSDLFVYPSNIKMDAVDGTYNSYIKTEADKNILSVSNGVSNLITQTSTETTFSKDIDMGGNNLNNCANCWNTTINNSKVNKSGDNMTGDLNIINNNVTANAFYHNPLHRNNYQTVFDINQLVNAPVFELNGSGIGNQIIFNLFGNPSTDLTSGRIFSYNEIGKSYSTLIIFSDGSMGWGNGTAGRDVYLQRSGINNLTITSDRASGQGNLNVTGDIKMPKYSGSGNDYACFDSTGKLFRSDTAC